MAWGTLQIAIVLALVVVVFFGFVRERLPPDVVAMGAVAILLATGILATDEALGVFSNSAPITVACMFVLSAALERTGVIDLMGRRIAGAAGRSPWRAVGALMLSVMALSAFINNTPVVVILTPVAIALAQALGTAPSKLLIPLSFASIFGGTTTLIGTSTNILVDGVAQDHGLAAFGMFEITLPGLAMGLLGIVYLLVFGRWLLPERQTLANLLPDPGERRFLAEIFVAPGSPLIGKTPADAGLSEKRDIDVIDVIRRNVSRRWSLEKLTIQLRDRLVLRTKAADVVGLREAGAGTVDPAAPDVLEPAVIMEGIVGPLSRLVGRRIADLNLRRLYGVYILAVHRRNEDLRSNFDEVRLSFGDTLLLEGPAEGLKRLFDDQELVNLSAPSERPFRRAKAPVAVAAIVLVMALAAVEVLPIAALAVIAATAVVAFGCLTPDEAYGSIRWRILILIFGMLALGVAMEKTGAADLIVGQITRLVVGFGPVAVLATVYLLTSMLTEVMSNNAAAILLTPIAIGLAEQLGVDPRPFAVAVMFAASASFATPIGYQTNTFVYGAGGYRFGDFIRIGLPLNLLMWAAASFLIPLFWPLD